MHKTCLHYHDDPDTMTMIVHVTACAMHCTTVFNQVYRSAGSVASLLPNHPRKRNRTESTKYKLQSIIQNVSHHQQLIVGWGRGGSWNIWEASVKYLSCRCTRTPQGGRLWVVPSNLFYMMWRMRSRGSRTPPSSRNECKIHAAINTITLTRASTWSLLQGQVHVKVCRLRLWRPHRVNSTTS